MEAFGQQASNSVALPVPMADGAAVPSSNLVGKRTTDLLLLDEGLSATTDNHCQALAQLSSGKHVAQGCLDLFRSAQETSVKDILAG